MNQNQVNTQNESTEAGTGCASRTYTTNYPFDGNYGQYCFSRLPCGICTRTNQMCPLVSNSRTYTPFIYCNDVNTASCDTKDGEIKGTM